MKNQAIVCNIGHFDNEIDVAGSKNLHGKKLSLRWITSIFPDGKRIILLAKGRLVNLGCGTGHPSYRDVASFANQTIAQIELYANQEVRAQVYVLPKHLDEKVALASGKIGRASDQTLRQAIGLYGVPQLGPFKPDTYRY